MKLEFDFLSIQNFKSFVGVHELDFKSFGVGLHFLRGRNLIDKLLGSNGAGKSSLWDAVCWCLYGKTPDGLKNPDIQPWFGKKATRVSVKIAVGGGTSEITRTTHPNRLLIDDKEVGQEAVDTLLGVGSDLFCHTILLGQGQPLFFDLSPKGKMDLFVDVLQLDRWDQRSTHAASKVSELQQAESVYTGTISGLEARAEGIGSLLKKAREQSAEWDEEQQQLIASAADRLKDLRTSHEKLSTEYGGLDLAYDGASTEVRQLEADTIKARKVVLAKQTAWNTACGEAFGRRDAVARLTRELADLKTSKVCPTCGQAITRKNIQEHKEDLEVEIRNLENLGTGTPTGPVKDAYDAATEIMVGLDRALTQFRKTANEARDKMDFMLPRISQMDAEIKQLERTRKKDQQEQNPYTDQISTMRKQQIKIKNEAEQTLEKLQKLTAQIERTRFWVKGFKDVRLYVIEDVLQELELTTNSALEDMGLLDWQVRYSIEKETKSGTIQRGLNVMILSPRTKEAVRWESWSGGERQRLRIVGALALSEVLLARAGVDTKLEILDEPIQHLSGEGVRDLRDYLAARARQNRSQIWYADHQSVQSAQFTSVLTVIKSEKGSYLE